MSLEKTSRHLRPWQHRCKFKSMESLESKLHWHWAVHRSPLLKIGFASTAKSRYHLARSCVWECQQQSATWCLSETTHAGKSYCGALVHCPRTPDSCKSQLWRLLGRQTVPLQLWSCKGLPEMSCTIAPLCNIVTHSIRIGLSRWSALSPWLFYRL